MNEQYDGAPATARGAAANPRGTTEIPGRGTGMPARAVRREKWPWLVILALVTLMAVAMRIEDRRWWCECAAPRPFAADIWSSHCSQHLLDPYSITHFSHGLILGPLLMLLVPRWSTARKLMLAVAIAAAWEVLENSPFIIDRYRSATMSLNYLGDSVVNSTGDLLCCMLGTLVALRIGWKWSIALLIALDALLLWWIRDSLIVSTFMLIWPIDSIKQWQTASAPPM